MAAGERILAEFERAVAGEGAACVIARETLRAGPFPIGREGALRIARADLARGPAGQVAVFERPAAAWASVFESEAGGFEIVLETEAEEVVLGASDGEELAGAVSVTEDGTWWLVVEGEAAGTLWAHWEERWAPAYEVRAGEPRLSSLEEWLRRLEGS
ncbi:MAG: hypothetical protein QM765_09455 [Myxococcales bacterium]